MHRLRRERLQYSGMRVRTMGRLELEDASFGRPKPLLLLVYLALEGPKHRRHLAELFWPKASRPMNSLRVALSQLRKGAPGALAEDGERVSADVELDAAELLSALERRELQLAVDLHRGPFVDGIHLPSWGSELEEWVYGTREFLGRRVREAVLELAERDAAAGEFAAAAGRVRAIDALPGVAEPEALARQHRLLAAAGDPAADAVRREAEGYGMSLDLAPDDARRQLLRGPPPDPGATVVAHDLPVPATSFVGRDPELLDLAALLAAPDARLVTIAGAGGVGKTRLALQAAQQQVEGGSGFDAVHFVPLDALESPEHLPFAIAAALELTLPGRAGPMPELIAALGERRRLVVLDNFEHLMDARRLLAELIAACAGLTLLVTSRERLALEAEQLFPIDGLPVPSADARVADLQYQDAARLFAQRALRVRPDFALTEENVRDVIALCRLVEGSPLGLELAAPWVRLLPVGQIVSEIERSLDFLGSSAADRPDRHQSLRAAFEHSWRLLAEREREALRRLSVFVGGFTRVAAAEVADATLPVLASLVDKSLLRVGDVGRFERHPLVHAFAAQKFRERPWEAEAMRAAHAAWCADLAGREARRRGGGLAAGLERLEREHDNLRAALRWTLGGGDPALGLRLAASLYRFWYYRSHFVEGRRWLERALDVDVEGSDLDAVRADALQAAGVLALEQGDVARAEAHLRARLALSGRIGDAEGRAAALNSLGVLAWGQQDYDEARLRLEDSLQIRRGLGRDDLMLPPLANLGLIALAQGDLEAAQRYFEETLDLCRRAEDAMGEAIALSNLGALHVDRGDATAARARFADALPRYRELGDKDGVAHCLEGFAAVATLDERFAVAAHLAGAAEALREEIGSQLSESDMVRRDRRLAPTYASLGRAAFATLADDGRKMGMDEAAAFALRSTGADTPFPVQE